jgi:nitrogen fixation protein NifQ
MSCANFAQIDTHLDLRSLPNFRQQYFDQLMACAGQSSNSVWLAQIISSWQVGMSALPDYLGLQASEFQQLLTDFFPGFEHSGIAVSGVHADFSRMLEKHDLELFLRRYSLPEDTISELLVTLIVTACLGSDHLWQDLGLWSRNDLSALLLRNFPELSQLNDKNMKWKKFLYKQLCEAEGIYVCRAPSCEVCQDQINCFGAEH